MERATWLRERRAAVVADYDTDAAIYQSIPNYALRPTNQEFLAALAASCPPGATVLDAPCGEGRCFPVLAAAGLSVVGVDQSRGMLAQARGRDIAVALVQGGLQELPLVHAFAAAVCLDAMENVPPEDWPLVLANLHGALAPGGHLYLTVEEIAEVEVDRAFQASQAQGLPAVRGEVVEGNVAGSHDYPGKERVDGWLRDAGLVPLEEGYTDMGDWGYRHLLVRSD